MNSRFLRSVLLPMAALCLAACDFGTPIKGGGGTEGEGLWGTLVDENGARVAGAFVRAYSATDSTPGLARRAAAAATVLDSSVTNSRGLFDLRNLLPGTYNLAASFRRGDTALALFIPGVMYAGGKQSLGLDTLLPAGSASLQVWLGDSLLIGATCFVAGSPYRTVSNEDGNCILLELAPGNLTILVSYPGYNLSAANPSGVTAGLHSNCGAVDIGSAGGLISWKPRASGTTFTLDAVTWGEDRVVAVGARGTIVTSEDGVNWTQAVSGTSNNLYGVAFGDGRWVAVGEDIITLGPNTTASASLVLASEDGLIWQEQTVPSNIPLLYGVTWDGSRFIAVGGDGYILTSPDGLDWSNARNGTTGTLYGAAWAGNQYFVFGYDRLFTSPDGANWIPRSYTGADPNGRDLYGIAWTGTRYVAVGSDNTILTSPDGATWSLRTSERDISLYGISAAGNRLVVVGDSGTVRSSLQGDFWTAESSGTTRPLRAVTYAGNRYVAVGFDGTIVTSP